MALATAFSGEILNTALTGGINQALQELLSQLAAKWPSPDFNRVLK